MSAVKLARFELPNRLVRNEETATDTYAQFIAEPFERGYGHTIGNSLRRVLLSSLEGASITSVRIAGVQHEFSSLPGVVEDVTDIVLNLKKVKFSHNEKDPRILTIKVEKEGVVTAGDIMPDHIYDIVNKDQVICTLDKKVKFDCEFEVRVGRTIRKRRLHRLRRRSPRCSRADSDGSRFRVQCAAERPWWLPKKQMVVHAPLLRVGSFRSVRGATSPTTSARFDSSTNDLLPAVDLRAGYLHARAIRPDHFRFNQIRRRAQPEVRGRRVL